MIYIKVQSFCPCLLSKQITKQLEKLYIINILETIIAASILRVSSVLG